MGDITDFIKKAIDISKSDEAVLNAAESAIKAATGVVSAVNTTKTILTALGIFQNTDEIAAAVHELKAAFDDVLDRVDEHTTMLLVADQLGMAETALNDLRNLAPDDPAAVGDANWVAVRGHTLDAPSDALNNLEKDGYWMRPFFPEAVYKDAWVGERPPPHNGYVFDYRYTLPAYLEVINIWLITRSAMVTDWRQKYKADFNNRANFLEDKFSRIRERTFFLDPPRLWQVLIVDGTSDWNDRGRLFGAFEEYSTFHQVDAWPENEYPLYNTDTEAQAGWPVYIRFVIRYVIRSYVRLKQVHKQVGLAGLARLIVQFKVLGGISQPTITGGWTEDWSVRQLVGLLGPIAQWLASDPARINKQEELAKIFAGIPGSGFGTGTDPQFISLRRVLQVLQTLSPAPYTSLRAALTQ